MAKNAKANNKKSTKKPEKKPAKKEPANPQPRQKVLPGMQDRRIAALENAALKYADIRDERMGWTKREVEAKKKVQELMHDQGRQHYERGNIEIDLVPEGEHVRVRVRDRENPDAPIIDAEFQDPEVDEPPVKEPNEDEPPAEEPEDPDQVYDSRVSDSRVKEPSDF